MWVSDELRSNVSQDFRHLLRDSSLTWLAVWVLVLARPQFLSTWAASQSCLSVLETWLPPKWVTQETKVESAMTFRPIFRCHTWSLLPYSRGHTGHDYLTMIHRRWRVHKNSRFQEARITGGHPEAHYHKGKKLFCLMNTWKSTGCWMWDPKGFWG